MLLFFKFALISVIVLLIYKAIIEIINFIKKKKQNSFAAITDLTIVLPNEKNVIYMILQNPYTTTTLTKTSTPDKINQFNTSVTNLQQFKKDVVIDLYSVDNFIKSVLVNYNYIFDKSVTTQVDFSKESLTKSFDLATRMWSLCGTTTYKDALNYLLSDSTLFQMYMDALRKANIVLDGQANNPVIASTTTTVNTNGTTTTSDGSSSIISSPNWGTSVRYTRGISPYGIVTPYPSNAIQAFGFQRVASISQNVKLSQKTYVLSTFATARVRDGTGDNSPSGMYVFNDTTKPTQLVKANPIEVSLSLTKTTTSTVTKTPPTTTTPTTTTTTSTTTPTTTTSTSVSKNGLQTLITTTTTIVEDATKIVTTVTTITKSIIGIIIPKNSNTWQQDLFTFDVPEENTYTLSFTSTWSASDRTSFLTDIILSDVTPFDFPPVDYKCKKPTFDTTLKYIKSSRDSDIQEILSYYGVVEKMTITGNDISNSVVGSLTQCKNLCDINNVCAGFVMENTTNKCYLKSNADSVNSVKSDISTLYKKKPSSTYSQFANKNSTGNDLFNIPNTLSDITVCTNACDLTPGCKAYVFDKTGKRCYLKSDIGTTTDSTSTDIYSKDATINTKLNTPVTTPATTTTTPATTTTTPATTTTTPTTTTTTPTTTTTSAASTTTKTTTTTTPTTSTTTSAASTISSQTTTSVQTAVQNQTTAALSALSALSPTTSTTTTTTTTTTPTTTTTTTTTPTTTTATSTITSQLSSAKTAVGTLGFFTNTRTGSFGNIKEKFGAVTSYPTDVPVNPYLNKYIQFLDNTYAFVYRDGTVRRIGNDTDMANFMGINGCPAPGFKAINVKLFKLNVNDVKLLPTYDPPLIEGTKMVIGDSCFVDGTKITYINDYMPVQTNMNAPSNDLNKLTGTTVDLTKAACNANAKCAGFVFDNLNKIGYLKSNVNIIGNAGSNGAVNVVGGAQANVDLYRRKAVDQNGKDITNKTEVNPYLNSYVYQKNVHYAYVTTDGELRDASAKDNNDTNTGRYNCPYGKVQDSDGRTSSLNWFVPGSDYTKMTFDPPFLNNITKVSMPTTEKCVVMRKPNPFLKQYIRYKSGNMYYVTGDATMRKIPTWYILDSISGKNGCPLSTDYIQLETDDYNYINTMTQIQPPLKLGQDLVFSDYCIAPTVNPYLGKIIQYTNGTNYYVTTLGLVRNIPTTDILNSIVGKNGCPLTTAIQKVNTNDYNTLGVFTPPLLPGTDMTYSDYCTGFTPVLTDITKLQLPTVTAPDYKSLYFDNSIKANEIYLRFNGQYLKLTTDMTSEQRKSALYEFITKNYF